MATHALHTPRGLLDADSSSESGIIVTDRDRLITFLESRGADRVRHSGGSFLDHLVGVETLLKDWEEAAPTVLAGLFHSVYGTENFRRAILQPKNRTQVCDLIGERAERLAHIYCGMRAESFFKALPGGPPYSIVTRWEAEPVDLCEEDMRAIAAVFTANWLEQFPRMRAKSRAQRIPMFRRLADWIGGAPGEAIKEAYGFGCRPIEIQRSAPDADAPDREKIEVWDDAVPKELQVQLSGLMDLNIWRYGWKASSEQTSYGFWHSHFGGDDDLQSSSCEHDLIGRPLIKPVLDLWRMLEAGPLQGHVPVRVYANGHTFGGDGHLHRDHGDPGHFTTIYYAHPVWEPNWAGETVFFNHAQDEIIRAVYPKPGRLAHFPGYIMHAARSPGRECSALRAVVVLKSRLKRPNE